MDKFITIITTQYPHEAHMIKSKLESEGVSVFLKDELTVQSHNFISNAIGGVKVQIRSSDLLVAQSIFQDIGLQGTHEEDEPSFGLVKWAEIKLDKVSFLKKWPGEVRILAFIGLIMLLLVLLVYALGGFA